MSDRTEAARKHYGVAREHLLGTPHDTAVAAAAALTGLLSLAIEGYEGDEREDRLDKLHTEADDALGRVLALADELEATGSGSSLKPVAFQVLAQRIREAVEG